MRFFGGVVVITPLPQLIVYEELSSSHVTISRLLFFSAQSAYAARFFFSQASPVFTSSLMTEPLCMSSTRFGTTRLTSGNFAKPAASFGNFVNGSLLDAGTLEKSSQGQCFRAKLPALQTVDACAGGRFCAKPTNDLPAAINAAPRFWEVKGVVGQVSSQTVSVLPAKNAM